MASNFLFGGYFTNYFMTGCFLLATLLGLNFYYTGEASQMANIMDSPTEITFWEGLSVFINQGLLETLSSLNPIIILKSWLLLNAPGDLFTFVNLFILRPIGWIFTFIEAEWIINKLRGIGG